MEEGCESGEIRVERKMCGDGDERDLRGDRARFCSPSICCLSALVRRNPSYFRRTDPINSPTEPTRTTQPAKPNENGLRLIGIQSIKCFEIFHRVLCNLHNEKTVLYSTNPKKKSSYEKGGIQL